MSMDTQSAKLFSELIVKDVSSLLPDEAAFLRARRDYMSDQERERFASILEAPKKEAPAASGSKADDKEPKLDRRALWKEAKGMGIALTQDMTAPQIKALIDQAKFDQEAAKEEAEAKAAERKALEDRAAELEVEGAADMSDEDLLAAIQLADEAKAQSESGAGDAGSQE